jgi:hypothetical protein
MSDDKLQTDINRGQRAEQLLADPLLTEAFEKLESEYIAFWKNTGTRAEETNARERIWHAVQVIGKVRSHLRSVMADGTIARKELDDLIDKKPKRFGIV